MLKLIFVSYFILGVSKAEIEYVNKYNSPELRFDNYITMYRRQHADIFIHYETQFENFRTKFLDSLDVITVQLDLLIDTIVKNEANLYPLQYLSDAHRICIDKYRSDLPTTDYARNELTRCGQDIHPMIDSILYKNLKIRNSLEQYYESYFEKEIKLCTHSSISPQDYEYCVFNVTYNTSLYTIRNQEYFSKQLDTADCEAEASLKEALRCNFAVHIYAISKISEVNKLIKTCIADINKCGRCGEYKCPEIRYLTTNLNSKTIQNPFYGYDESLDCVMLRAKN